MKSNKLIFIALSFVLVLVIGGVIIFKKATAEYPMNNTGKYANYIDVATKEFNKELKKKKINNGQYIYSNVIYENEKAKAELSSLNDNDTVAEYLVCLMYKSNDEISEPKYYMLKIPYVKYKNTLNDQLEIAKGMDYQSIISDGIKAGTDVVGAVADANIPKKKAEKSVLRNIGRAIGGVVGSKFGSKKGGEEIGEFIGGIAPSVIEGVKNLSSNIMKQFQDNSLKLNEFIDAMPEEEYKATLNDFSTIIIPNIEIVSDDELKNYYLSENEIKLLYKTQNKCLRRN